MTSGAYAGYLVRYLKQVGYIKQRKIRKGEVHRHKKSLFISNESHSVTISGVLDYILKSTQYKQFPQKKKKKKQMRKLEKKRREEEKMGGEVERRRNKINRKTERAAQKMHRPLRTHSLAKS